MALEPLASPSDGDFITRRFWIKQVTERWANVMDPWEAYAPEWTSSSGAPAVGDGGSLTGAFKVIGSVVCVRLRMLYGGTGASTGSGPWSFTLPDGFLPLAGIGQTITGWCFNGTTRLPVSAALSTNGVDRMGINNNLVGPSVPFTWATDDHLVLGGEYEWGT